MNTVQHLISQYEHFKYDESRRILVNIILFCFRIFRMKAAIDELAPGNNVEVKLSEDGSGRGAAMVAAVAMRLK